MRHMRHARIAFLLSALLVSSSGPAGAQGTAAAPDFDVEGKYRLVQPVQPTETGPATVEVVDVFWFGCPHCYRFLAHMEAFEKQMPEYVRVRRMPAVFGENWIPHARAFYTAQLLGIDAEVHRPLFEAIHDEGRVLATREALMVFFGDFGVADEEFASVYDSFAVESLLRKSITMQERYGIQGTPSVVVNGKYWTSGRIAGSYDNVIRVVRALAERERAQHLALRAAPS